MLLIHAAKPKNNWRLRYLIVILSLIILVLLIHHWEIYMYPTSQKVSVFGIFLVRIFPDSDWIRKDTKYLSVFTPNAGKCRPEKLRIRTLFTQCLFTQRKMWKIFKVQKCSKTPRMTSLNSFGVFIVNFEHILHLFLVFL